MQIHVCAREENPLDTSNRIICWMQTSVKDGKLKTHYIYTCKTRNVNGYYLSNYRITSI